MARVSEFSDNFNRVNQTLETSTDWNNITGGATITSNEVDQTTTAVVSEYLISTASSDANCYAQYVATGTTTSVPGHGIILRADASLTSGYLVYFRRNSSDILGYRRDGGSWTLLGTIASSVTLADNDVLVAECTGTGATVTLEAFVNGVSQGTIDDTSGSRDVAAGRAGIRLYDTAEQLDDFEAGILTDALAAEAVTVSEEVRVSIKNTTASPYSQVYEIVIDNTKVYGSDELTSFPMLVKGTYAGSGSDPDLRTAGNGGDIQNTATGGVNGILTVPADLAFYDDEYASHQLAHEVTRYNATTGEFIAWVKVPYVSPTADTSIFMHFSDVSVTVSQEDVAGTWTDDYLNVVHFNEPGGTDANNSGDDGATYFDETGTPDHEQAGQIDYAFNFDGSSENVFVHQSSTAQDEKLEATAYDITQITQSFWIYTDTTSAGPLGTYLQSPLVDSDANALLSIRHFDATNNYLYYILTATPSNVLDSSTTLSVGAWHYVTMTWENNVGGYIFIDGSEILTPSTLDGIGKATQASIGSSYTIGGYKIDGGGASSQYYDGKIDEGRTVTTAHTLGWHQTEYANQNSPSTFYSISQLGSSGVSVSASDSTTVSENVSISISAPPDSSVSVSDSVSVSENVSIDIPLAPLDISVSDSTTVSESVNVDPPQVQGVEVDLSGTFFANGYTYRRTITVDNTQVSGSSNIPNFMFMFKETNNDFKTTGNGGLLQNGFDFAFYSDASGTTQLSHEIATHSYTTGEVVAWVKIPSLSYSADTEIYLFYGKTGVSNQSDPTNAWSDYTAVFHLNEADGVEPIDSLGNITMDTTTGNPTEQQTGQIDDAVDFLSGNNNFYRSTTYTHGSNVTQFSIGFWINTTAVGTAPLGTFLQLCIQDGDNGNYIAFRHYNNAGTPTLRAVMQGTPGDMVYDFTSSVSTGAWHYISLRAEDNGTHYKYLDGSQDGTYNGAANTFRGEPGLLNTFGSYNNGGSSSQWYNGLIDEVWYRTDLITVERHATEFANQSAPGTFYTLGTATEAGGGESVVVSENVQINLPQPDANISVSDSVTVSENVSISISAEDIDVSASDSTTVNDAPTVFINEPDLKASTSDTTTLSENVSLSISPAPLTVSASDSITVTDTPSIQEPQFGTLSVHTAEPGYTNGFVYRRTVTINRNAINSTSTYPVLNDVQLHIFGTYSYLAHKDYGGELFSHNAYDIIFTDTLGTQLDHYIETYDETTGEIHIIVHVTDVNTDETSTDTEIYMYHTKSGATDQQVYSDTWIQTDAWTDDKVSFAAHFEDNAFVERARSLATTTNSVTYNTGKIGDAMWFDGSTSYATSAYPPGVNGAFTFMFSAWFYINSNTTGINTTIISRMDTNPIGWIFGKDDNDNLFLWRNYLDEPINSNFAIATGYTVAFDTWVHIHMELLSTTNAPRFQVNGTIYQASPSPGFTVTQTTNTDLWLGDDPNGYFNKFEGGIDELVMAQINGQNVGISLRETIYNNQSNPSNFYTVDDPNGVTISEAIQLEQFERNATTSDTVTVTDTPTIFLEAPTPTPNISELVTVTDTPTIFVGVPFPTPNVSDTATISESVSVRVPELIGSASDTVSVSESVSAFIFTPPRLVFVDEAVIVNDYPYIQTPDLNVPNITDTVSTSESVQAILYNDLISSDSVAVSENVNVTVSAPQVYGSDNVTVIEGVGGSSALVMYASETITVSDNFNPYMPYGLIRGDLTIVFDFPDIDITNTIQVSDTVTVSESVKATTVFEIKVSETVTVTDTPTVQPLLERISVSDTITASDANTTIVREPPLFKPNITDNVTVGEGVISVAVLEAGALGISVVDKLTVTDTSNVELPFPGIQVSDSVTVTDTPSAVTPTVLFVNVSDNIIVNDIFTPDFVDIVIPPASHNVHVYDVTVVTEQWVVDRDIWGGNIPDEEDAWTDASEPTTVYKEVPDPTTDWREQIDHER